MKNKFPNAMAVIRDFEAQDAHFALAMSAFLEGLAFEPPQKERFNVSARRSIAIAISLANDLSKAS